MRKVLSSLMTIILIFGLIPTGLAAVNEAVVKGSIGTSWLVTSSGVTEADASFKLSTENVCPGSGPYSLKMEHNNNVSGTIAIKIPVSLVANSTYKITFKSTESMTSGTQRTKVILGPSATGWVSGCKQFSNSNGVTTTNLTNGWMQHSYNFTAKSANLYLSLQTDMSGNNRYFDDFEISLLDAEGAVVENLEIPNYDFNFKNPYITNITVDKNVISWTELESYDVVNIYEKGADGLYVKLTELAYPESSYTAEILAEPKTYYITTVTGGEESLEAPITVVPDKQISEITLQNANQDTVQNLEAGTLKASISIENNHLDEPIKAQLIAALYKDDVVIISQASEPATINKNGAAILPTVLSANIPITSLEDGEYRLEIFVWDSFKAMNIVKNSVTINELPSDSSDGEGI